MWAGIYEWIYSGQMGSSHYPSRVGVCFAPISLWENVPADYSSTVVWQQIGIYVTPQGVINWYMGPHHW